jgi:ferredoxin-NADP reductase
MLQPWRNAIVTKIEQQTPTTRSFFIQVPELDVFDFKPGQFVTLDLPIHEKSNKRWRSYSIASSPNGTNTFELCIVQLEGGAGTKYLFDDAEVKVGSELLLRGPVGVFTLPEVLEKDLFLICTGTGIAPFRSMVKHIIQHNIAHQNIHLIFGCRTADDVLYLNEMKQLMELDASFKFYVAYSREQVNEIFAHNGYVHQVYEKICKENMINYLENADNKIVKPANFYLCGWRGMIDDATKKIIELGYDKKSIHVEIYG